MSQKSLPKYDTGKLLILKFDKKGIAPFKSPKIAQKIEGKVSKK